MSLRNSLVTPSVSAHSLVVVVVLDTQVASYVTLTNLGDVSDNQISFSVYIAK